MEEFNIAGDEKAPDADADADAANSGGDRDNAPGESTYYDDDQGWRSRRSGRETKPRRCRPVLE